MTLQFGVLVPQGWTMDLAQIDDPVEAYETMTRVAQTAEEVGFAFSGNERRKALHLLALHVWARLLALLSHRKSSGPSLFQHV